MKINADSFLLLDNETGEIIELENGTKIITPEEWNNYRKKIEKTMLRMSDNPFFLIDSSHQFLIKPQDLTRLIYLATYLSYDGELKCGRRTITKQDLPEILGISKHSAYNFYNHVNRNNYLFQNSKGTLSLNSEILFKGKLKKHKYKTWQQIFSKEIKKIYESVAPSQHKQLGYFFMLIPYINREYNILCENPDEPELENIRPLTLKDFCSKINFREDNVYKLINTINSIQFDVNGVPQHFVAFVSTSSKIIESKICINPNIIYVGNQIKKAEVLKLFFKK